MEALSEILVRRASVECCAILLVSGLLVSRDIVDLLLTFMLSSWQSCMVFKLPGVEVSRKLSESDALNALDLVFDDNLMSHILINLSSTIFFSSITLIGRLYMSLSILIEKAIKLHIDLLKMELQPASICSFGHLALILSLWCLFEWCYEYSRVKIVLALCVFLLFSPV